MIELGNALDAQVRFVAGVEQRAPDELLVEAVSRYCLAQLADPGFRDKARKHIQRQQQILTGSAPVSSTDARLEKAAKA